MLNGTLETFALPDVLALLSATKKTGELQVNGGRGEARVWLDKGEMVAADVPRATTFVDALFEMLRLTSGNFAFESDRTPASPSGPMAVDPLLREAQSRLGEWKSIEAVVPSLACAVRLAAEVSGPQVSVTAEQWRTLVAVATNADVEGVMTTLGLGEFDSCRMLKDLVQIGLVSIDTAPPAGTKADAGANAAAKAPAPEPVAAVVETPEAAAPAAERPAFRTPVSAPAALERPVSDRPAFRPPAPASLPPRPASGSTLVAAAHTSQNLDEDERKANGPARSAKATTNAAKPPTSNPDQENDDLDSVGLVHQLAELQSDNPSPAPHPAVASATEPPSGAGAETQENAAKGEEPLNRGLLLKFLNSVRA